MALLKFVLKKQVVDWIHLAQDRDQWWALSNTEINLRFQ
jgi:hypothetical protein